MGWKKQRASIEVDILDERDGADGKHHDVALAALPVCLTTEKIEDMSAALCQTYLRWKSAGRSCARSRSAGLHCYRFLHGAEVRQ